MNKVTHQCFEEFFKEEVLKFNMSKKTAQDLYQFTLSVWRVTKVGSYLTGPALTWPEIEQIIKTFTP